MYNDFADFWHLKKGEQIKPGYVYISEGKYCCLCNKRNHKATIGICTDTYGSSVGQGDLPLAVAGFVLAFVDKIYPVGIRLIANKKGILTKARFWEKNNAFATFQFKEPQNIWKDINVNGRCWVKIIG